MLRIVLIRPGSTDYDQQERIQGALDIPLNAAGLAEVARIAEELRDKEIDMIYAAPCEPAQQTGDALAKALAPEGEAAGRECRISIMGCGRGCSSSDVRRKQPKVYRQWQEQPENVCPPEGEMLSHAQERVRTCMTKLLKRHKEGVVAMVASEPLAIAGAAFPQAR